MNYELSNVYLIPKIEDFGPEQEQMVHFLDRDAVKKKALDMYNKDTKEPIENVLVGISDFNNMLDYVQVQIFTPVK